MKDDRPITFTDCWFESASVTQRKAELREASAMLALVMTAAGAFALGLVIGWLLR